MEHPRAKALKAAVPQLIADVTLYPTEAGGKKIPALPGWGCPCTPRKTLPVIGYDGWPLLGDTPLAPGERRRLGFVFLRPQPAINVLRRAGTFYLWEGGPIGEAVVVQSDARPPVTDIGHWRSAGPIVAAGEPISLDGLNPWQCDWIDANEPPFEITHPLYPSQKHIMDVYKISVGSKTVKFAAGELANGSWGFYLPSPPAPS